ncbi:MAG: cytidylate kinase-like family protein [Pseudomonadota bacterium]
MKNFVIAIARGFGSGGKYIGSLLSQELGIPCYDTQLPAMLEEYSGINKAKFASRDEKLPVSYALMKLLPKATTPYTPTPMEKEFVSDNNLFNIQAELIRELARSRSCIIIGKCANHILENYHNVVSVYIEAPRKVCVDNITKHFGLTEGEAHTLIQKTDKYRADYYRYYTDGKIWTDPVAYHMTLNTAKVSRDHCTQLIINYLRLRGLCQ